MQPSRYFRTGSRLRELTRIVCLLLFIGWNSTAAFGMASISKDGTAQKVLLCTQNGYEWVSIESADAASTKSDGSTHQRCTFCLFSNGDDLLDGLNTADNYVAILTPHRVLAAVEPQQFKILPVSLRHSRAPPQ